MLLTDYKILVKFPSRERPDKFFRALDLCIEKSTKHNIHYLVSLDTNDASMNNEFIKNRLNQYKNLTYYFGESKSKVEAVNRDIYKIKEWDILVLMSDDMICQSIAWDEILRSEMDMLFPDTDGCLFHWDGDANTQKHNNGQGLCTMNITGRKYFDKFGYAYHPSYISLWCDNEYTDVAQLSGKMAKFEDVLFKHDHYSNNGTKQDQLMQRTQSFYNVDGQNYQRRKQLGFTI